MPILSNPDWLLKDSDSQLAFLLAIHRKPPEQAQERLDIMARMYADEGKLEEWQEIAALLPEVGKNAAVLDWWNGLSADLKLKFITRLFWEANY